jgi:phosphoribosyl-AMP cyclohydrolase
MCQAMSSVPSTLQFAARDSKEAIEEGLTLAPKFDEHGLIAAMAIDWKTNEPLMLAYMNEESLRMTLAQKKAVYWSRSRKKLWLKGETSGEVQLVKEIYVDCDQDALVLKVEQLGGGCCHTKRATCFYRKVDLDKVDAGPVTLVKE